MTDPLDTPTARHDIPLDRLEPPREGIRPPAIEGLADAHAALELAIDAADAEVGESQLRALDGYRALLSKTFRPGPVFTLSWPPSWFIPTDVDHREFWPVAPPIDNRYDWAAQNTIGGQPAGSHASSSTGELFAWGNTSHLGPPDLGIARTGIYLRPTESLATYRLGADIDVTTEWRWWFLPTGNGYGSVAYRCQVYLVAWQVNPADGSWELLRPYGSRVLVQQRITGAGYSPVDRDEYAFDDLTVDVQLQGGRTYAIGVSFEVQVTTEITDGRGTRYARRPGDEIKLWASMLGRARRITARPITVWIP